MPGTKAGAAKAAATVKKKYGKDFYARFGAKGGKLSKGGGFAISGLASIAGRRGGKISKRGYHYDKSTGTYSRKRKEDYEAE